MFKSTILRLLLLLPIFIYSCSTETINEEPEVEIKPEETAYFVNGDFEDWHEGFPANWEYTAPDSQGFSCEQDNYYKKSGESCVRIERANAQCGQYPESEPAGRRQDGHLRGLVRQLDRRLYPLPGHRGVGGQQQ